MAKLEKGFKCPLYLKSMFAGMNMTGPQKRAFMEAEQTRTDAHRQMLKRKWVDVLSEENSPKKGGNQNRGAANRRTKHDGASVDTE